MQTGCGLCEIGNGFFVCQLDEVQSSNLIESGGVHSKSSLKEEIYFFFAVVGT